MNHNAESQRKRQCLLIETTTLLDDKGGKTIPTAMVIVKSLYSVEGSRVRTRRSEKKKRMRVESGLALKIAQKSNWKVESICKRDKRES